YKNHFLGALMMYLSNNRFFENEKEQKKWAVLLSKASDLNASAKDYFFQMRIENLYSDHLFKHEGNTEKALFYIDKAIKTAEQNYVGERYLLDLYLKKAKLLNHTDAIEASKEYIHKAFLPMLKDPLSTLNSLSLSSFENRTQELYIRNLENAADLYTSFYKKENDTSLAKTALHLYRLAGGVFSQYYLEGAYKPKLNSINKNVSEGIFNILLQLEMPIEEDLVNLLENNTSQHLRKEFEQKQLQNLAIPDSVLTQ